MAKLARFPRNRQKHLGIAIVLRHNQQTQFRHLRSPFELIKFATKDYRCILKTCQQKQNATRILLGAGFMAYYNSCNIYSLKQ